MALEETLGVVVERDVAVTMRDGVVLRANVFRPAAAGRFPAILERTPYGKGAGGKEEFVHAGFAVVTQDSRGRYASDGQYTVFSECPTGDAEDGYDTVEWVAAQPWCSGSVGTMGASYNGWMQWQLARLRPPHLRAMSATAIPMELTDLDYTGSFRPARRMQWWFCTIGPDLRRRAGMGPPHNPAEARAIWTEIEQGRRLHGLPWIDVVKDLPPPLDRHAAQWLRDPTRRPWRFDEAHHQIEVPNLDLTGWYDHCNDGLGHLAGMKRHGRTPAARDHSQVIIGPWNHVGVGSRQTGDFDFGPSAQLSRPQILIRWFNHWLKGEDNGVDRESPIRYFVLGSQVWKEAHQWPPPDMTERTLFLDSRGDAAAPARAGRLVDQPSAEAGPPDRYTSDPHNPVPTLWTPQYFVVPGDRRRLEYRQDILYYRTEPLEHDLEIAGQPQVILLASSTAPDTDFFAWLVDEPNEGPAMDVSHGMVRARHRLGIARQDLLTPGEVTEFRIHLRPTACRFRRGHRVRLEIAGSSFPDYDRNHQTGGQDLLEARMQSAEQLVFRGPDHPSRLVLPVQAG